MNEKKSNVREEAIKSEENPRPRPKINLFSRVFVQLKNDISDRATNKIKPCEGLAQLDNNVQNQRTVFRNPDLKEPERKSLYVGGRTAGSSNYVRGAAQSKPIENTKVGSDFNPRQNSDRSRRGNLSFNRTSNLAKSDESLNTDKSPRFLDRFDSTQGNRRNFPINSKKISMNGKNEKRATDLSSNQPISNRTREISWSDESLNQNFPRKDNFQPKNGLSKSRITTQNTIHSVNRFGKVSHESFTMGNDYGKIGPKNHSRTLNPQPGKSSFNHAKVNYLPSYNSGRPIHPRDEFSKSTWSYEKHSSLKTNQVSKNHSFSSGSPDNTMVSGTSNRNEKFLKAEKNPSKETISLDFKEKDENKNLLSSPQEDKTLISKNESNNTKLSGYVTDEGSASISDEPDESVYQPDKQRQRKKQSENFGESAIQPIIVPSSSFVEFADGFDCPIPAPHSVDTFLSIVKDNDADSVSSENLEPMENYDLPEAEKNQEKFKDSECPDERIDPEVLKAVSSYLEKLEIEESQHLSESEKVVRDVNRVFNYLCKGNTVSLYGSYLSGLAVGLSNINLVLKTSQTEKNAVLLMLQKCLSKGLTADYDVEAFQEESSVRKSKIYFYTPSSVLCVIMFKMKPVSDYCKTTLLLKRICEFDPRVKTLIIAARKWAEACLLHEIGNNYIHPVGLALLVIHFLQRIEPAVLPIIDTSAQDLGLKTLNVENNLGIGELWFQFLKFYTKSFDWISNVVTIQHKDVLLKSDVNWECYCVAIQEPHSRKNISESLTTPEYIHSCFKSYYEHLFMGFSSSDSEADGNGSDSSGEDKYSFRDPRIKCPLPLFCEECAEMEDDLCENCKTEKNTSRVLEKLPELTDHSMKCIDKALLHVYSTVSLTEHDMKERITFVRELEHYIQKLYPNARLKLFGSSVNMFGLEKSDLDICLTFRNQTKNSIDVKKMLQRIVFHLRKNPSEYSGVFGLYLAKVPIVKFYSKKRNFLCDLSLYNVLSVHNSRLLSKYAMFDERCRIMGCALKYLTMKGWISDSSSKFLSSYSYIMMVIHYLQQTTPPVLPVFIIEDKEVFINNIDIPDEVTTNKNYWYNETVEQLRKRYKVFPRNESSTAELWLGFFEYYLKFDKSFAVTITQKEPMPVTELSRSARLFNIEDPFEDKRNLGGVLSEENADKTLKVLLKARSLFGRNVSMEIFENIQNHYFSTNNLLGISGKEMKCDYCGAFDHESEDCLKQDPFKKSTLRNSHPATRPNRRKV